MTYDKQSLVDQAAAIHALLQTLPDETIPEPIPEGLPPDPLVIYDGKGGADADELYAAYKPWGPSKWVDADGVYDGPKAFATKSVVKDQTGYIEIDATAVVQQGVEPQIVLRGSVNPTVLVDSKETGRGPKLEFKFADGSTEVTPSLHDVSLDPSTSYETGQRTTLTIAPPNPCFIRFPAPSKPVTSAKIILTINRVYANGTVSLFKFGVQHIVPELDAPFTIKGHPKLVWETECFQEAYDDLQAHASRPDASTPLPNHPQSGLGELMFGHSKFGNADHYDQRNIVDTPEGKVLRLTFDPAINGCISAHMQFPEGREALEAIVEFDLYLNANLLTNTKWGQKLFAGFSSSTANDDVNFASRHGLQVGRAGTLLKGNGGAKPYGADGWSSRSHTINPISVSSSQADPWPPAHPLHGHIPVGSYTYWPGQYGTYGDVWRWTGQGAIPIEQWVTICTRLKVNDVGQNNAELDVWVAGQPALKKRDFYLRTTDDPIISKPPYNVPSDLAIGSVWFATYHGGSPKAKARCWFDVRRVRLALP